MDIKKLWGFLLFVPTLQACSSKTIHNIIKGHEQQECLSAPRSQQNECMERANESYEEYSDKRKDVTKDK
jgi:hypothetical protein